MRRRPVALSLALTACVAVAMLAGCSGTGDRSNRSAGGNGGGALANPPDPGFGHVHGLGLNASDGAVYAATHYGVWRIPGPSGPGDGTADTAATSVRVADRWQDTMGFTVAGPDVFYGSGHPDLREDSPSLLGFIVSRDRARTWRPVSLSGSVDFHDLAAVGSRVYGYDATSGRMLVSSDTGRTWTPRAPEVLRDLTVDPTDPDRVLAISSGGLLVSTDAGLTFRAMPSAPELLLVDWADGMLAGVGIDGTVWVAPPGGPEGMWTRGGRLAGAPQAFTVAVGGRLLAADDDGVKLSADAGDTWTLLAGYSVGTSGKDHDGD